MKENYTIFTERERDKERRNRSLTAEEVTSGTNGKGGDEAERWSDWR